MFCQFFFKGFPLLRRKCLQRKRTMVYRFMTEMKTVARPDVVSGRKIAYSWKYGGNSGDSVVSFELFDEGGKTRLRLTHVGLETFAPETNPDFARGNFLAGWRGLDRLAKGFFGIRLTWNYRENYE